MPKLKHKSVIGLLVIIAIETACLFWRRPGAVPARENFLPNTVRRAIKLESAHILITSERIQLGHWPVTLSEAVAADTDMIFLHDLVDYVGADFDDSSRDEQYRQIKAGLESRYQYIPPANSVVDPSTQPAGSGQADNHILLIEKEADAIGNRLFITIDGTVCISHERK